MRRAATAVRGPDAYYLIHLLHEMPLVCALRRGIAGGQTGVWGLASGLEDGDGVVDASACGRAGAWIGVGAQQGGF